MKKVKLYNVYVDDGEITFRVTVPASTTKEAADYVRGNGEIVAIKEDKETVINDSDVYDAMRAAGFSRNLAEVVMRLVALSGLTVRRG